MRLAVHWRIATMTALIISSLISASQAFTLPRGAGGSNIQVQKCTVSALQNADAVFESSMDDMRLWRDFATLTLGLSSSKVAWCVSGQATFFYTAR